MAWLMLVSRAVLAACLSMSLVISTAGASAREPRGGEVTGRLPAGLSYAVRSTHSQPGKAVVYFIVRAGSAHDPEGRSSAAHVVEHLVATSGANTPWGTPADQIKRWNGTPGFDYNANSFDGYTSYFITVDRTVPSSLDDALRFFRAASQGLTFSDEAARREIAAVREETRQNDNASGRVTERNASLLFEGAARFSTTIDRNVAGLAALEPEDARAFYRRWYRPDLEALVVVGDIDPVETERQIRLIFADQLPGPPRVLRDIAPLRVERGARQGIFLDPMIDKTQLMLAFVKPRHPAANSSRYLSGLVARMVEARLSELPNAYSAPVESIAAMPIENSDAAVDILRLDAVLRAGREKEAVKSIVEVLKSIRASGFRPGEVAEAKRALLRLVSPDDIASIAASYLASFSSTGGFAAASFAEEHRAGIEAVMPADLDTSARTLIDPKISRWAFHIAASDRPVPKPVEIHRWWYTASRPLSAVRPQSKWIAPILGAAAPIRAMRTTPFGLVRLDFPDHRLSVLLRNSLEPDIEVVALTRTNLGRFDAVGRIAAGVASEVVQNNGLAGADKFGFGQWLDERSIAFQRLVEPDFSGVRARAPSDRIDDVLALLPLAFRRPQISPASWRDWRERRTAEIAGDVDAIKFDAAVANARGLFPPLSGSELEKLTPEAIENIYDAIFDGGERRVIMISGMLPDDIERKAAQVAGLLPSSAGAGAEAAPLRAEVAPSGDVIVSPGISGATVTVLIFGQASSSIKDPAAVNVASALLRPHMFARLRDVEKGTYQVLTNIGYDRFGRLFASVEFQCDPGNVDRLVAAIADEVAKVAADPGLDAEAEAARPFVRDIDPAKRSPFELAASLLRDPPDFVADHRAAVIGTDVRRIFDVLSVAVPVVFVRRPPTVTTPPRPAD